MSTTTDDAEKKSPIGYTVEGIINMAGGSSAVARELNVSVQSVRKWRYIPGWHARTVAIMAGLPMEIVRPDMVRAGHAQAAQAMALKSVPAAEDA